MNGHTQYKNSHFVLYIITKHNFIYLFYVLSLLFSLSLFIISRDNNQTLPNKKQRTLLMEVPHVLGNTITCLQNSVTNKTHGFPV